MLAAPDATVPRPLRYTVPRVRGDADAARRLAGAFRHAADELELLGFQAVSVFGTLDAGWRGIAADAADRPAAAVGRDVRRIVRGLRETAESLDRLSCRLRRAHEHHHWSLARIAALGAVVTVTTVAVVVTVGAAAPAEAAAIGLAVEGAEAAAGAAATATAATAGELGEASAAFAGVRPLLAWAAPHLVQAEAFAGLDAAGQLLATDQVNWSRVAVSGLAGFGGSAGAGLAGAALSGTPLAAAGGRALAWGGSAYAEQRLDGDPSSAGGLAMAAFVPEGQRLRELARFEGFLRDGVRLEEHEGIEGAHTLQRHVAKSWCYLKARAQVEEAEYRSSFYDLETANTAVTEVLRADADKTLSLLQKGRRFSRWFMMDVGRDVGTVVWADGRVSPASSVLVLLRLTESGLHVRTSYVEPH